MRKREFFLIQKFRSRYDREAGKFVFNIAYKTAMEMSPRTVAVAEAFGLGIDARALSLCLFFLFLVRGFFRQLHNSYFYTI